MLGLDATTSNFDLKRGIWLTGRVTDEETGAPIKAAVYYFVHIGIGNSESKDILRSFSYFINPLYNFIFELVKREVDKNEI